MTRVRVRRWAVTLVPWHPLAKQLEEKEYREFRACYQTEHQVKFRLVCREFRNHLP